MQIELKWGVNMDVQVQVLDRTLDILEYLSNSSQPKGPTEIANATGIHKSTIYRILTALSQRGYVVKNTPEGTYQIGIKLVEIVSHHIDNLELQTEARPYLNELHADLQLIVHLGILDQHEVIYAVKMDILPNLRLYSQIGMRVPAYCSSLGKCLLSCKSGDEVDYILSKCEMKSFTKKTITSVYGLRQHLKEVRSQGFAMDDEESALGHRCIGAPIYDYRGEIIAAVSASGSISLLTDDRIATVTARVKQTAAEISKRLCYIE